MNETMNVNDVIETAEELIENADVVMTTPEVFEEVTKASGKGGKLLAFGLGTIIGIVGTKVLPKTKPVKWIIGKFKKRHEANEVGDDVEDFDDFKEVKEEDN